MNRILIFLVILLAGLYHYKRLKSVRTQPREESLHTVIRNSNLVNSEKKKPPLRSSKVFPKTVQKKVVLSNSKKSGQGVFRFQVKEGNWAVTHGDQLLGQVGSDFKDKEGSARAPLKIQAWPSWQIHYAIDLKTPNKERIREAIDWFHSASEFEFIETDQIAGDMLAFMPARENCYSYVGRVGGVQPIMLSSRCGVREIAHEIMHALGFVHEQSRSDRDDYVEIIWKNIKKSFHPQFDIIRHPSLRSFLDYPFDFRSIMLYEKNAFAKSQGMLTIKARNERDRVLPKRNFFSALDQERLRNYFQIF